MLKFSISNKEFILVECKTITNSITIFFDQEFNQQFHDGALNIELPSFLRAMDNINSFLHLEKINPELTEEFIHLINTFPSYKSAAMSSELESQIILDKILQEGFTRTPTKDQLRNLQSLCAKKAAASFSVPGAGKTTEALGFYAFHKSNANSKLLV